jgi:hypothetical protein
VNGWHDEFHDTADNSLEGNGIDIKLVLPIEGSPLALLRFVVKNSAVKAIGSEDGTDGEPR